VGLHPNLSVARAHRLRTLSLHLMSILAFSTFHSYSAASRWTGMAYDRGHDLRGRKIIHKHRLCRETSIFSF